MKACLIGAGNMGCAVTGALLHMGHQVCVTDLDEIKVQCINDGKCPYPEQRGDAIYNTANRQGHLVASKDIDPKAEVILICVGTPVKNDGKCDITQLYKVLMSLVANEIDKPIMLLSTVFPGMLETDIFPICPDATKLFYCPVFLALGNGISDYLKPGKIVIGSPPMRDDAAYNRIRALINPILVANSSVEIKLVTHKVAEWSKLIHNIWMCAKITFANEIAQVIENFGGNIDPVTALNTALKEGPNGRLMTLSHMIPGPPFAGTCLPKDSLAAAEIWRDNLHWFDEDGNSGTGVLMGARGGRDSHMNHIIEDWKQGPFISLGIIGAVFRPGFNELRDSLALELVDSLKTDHQERLGTLRVWDPDLPEINDKEAWALVYRDHAGDDRLQLIRHHLVPTFGDILECDSIVVNRPLGKDQKSLLDRQVTNVIDLYKHFTQD